MKTIFMSKDKLDKWLAALRSGEYRQGTQRLCDEYGGYCCLGVLQHCLTGAVESDPNNLALAVPTLDWLSKNEIRFVYSDGEVGKAPYLPLLNGYATELNDGFGCAQRSFAELADAIEAAAEATA